MPDILSNLSDSESAQLERLALRLGLSLEAAAALAMKKDLQKYEPQEVVAALRSLRVPKKGQAA